MTREETVVVKAATCLLRAAISSIVSRELFLALGVLAKRQDIVPIIVSASSISLPIRLRRTWHDDTLRTHRRASLTSIFMFLPNTFNLSLFALITRGC